MLKFSGFLFLKVFRTTQGTRYIIITTTTIDPCHNINFPVCKLILSYKLQGWIMFFFLFPPALHCVFETTRKLPHIKMCIQCCHLTWCDFGIKTTCLALVSCFPMSDIFTMSWLILIISYRGQGKSQVRHACRTVQCSWQKRWNLVAALQIPCCQLWVTILPIAHP